MKEVYQILEVLDNWGGEQYFTSGKIIKDFLTDKESWTDDVTIYVKDQDGNTSTCFIDDLLGTEVIVEGEVVSIPNA